MPEPRKRQALGDATLRAMTEIYCHGHHGDRDGLCPECESLLAYALGKLARCPFGEDKPNCSDCRVHCYAPAMRARIQEVMRYAGPRMITRHPVMAVRHIVDGLRYRPKPLKRASGTKK